MFCMSRKVMARLTVPGAAAVATPGVAEGDVGRCCADVVSGESTQAARAVAAKDRTEMGMRTAVTGERVEGPGNEGNSPGYRRCDPVTDEASGSGPQPGGTAISRLCPPARCVGDTRY